MKGGECTNSVIETRLILDTVNSETTGLKLITTLLCLRDTRDSLLVDTTLITVQLGDRGVVNGQIVGGVRPGVSSVERLPKRVRRTALSENRGL